MANYKVGNLSKHICILPNFVTVDCNIKSNIVQITGNPDVVYGMLLNTMTVDSNIIN